MAWGILINGLGQLGTTLFIRDEKARAAANLAIAGVAAGCCDPTGSGVASAAISVAKEAATLAMLDTVEDPSARGGVLSGLDVVASAVSLDPLGASCAAGGALAGGIAGATAEANGVEGVDFVSGMSLGTNLASGSMEEIASKSLGATVGAVGGAVAGGQEDRADVGEMAVVGAQIGTSMGGSIGQLDATAADIAESKMRRSSFLDEDVGLEEIQGSITSDDVAKARTSAGVGLGGQAVGLGAAVAVHHGAAEEGDAHLADSLRAGQGVGSAFTGAAMTESRSDAVAASIDAAASGTTAVREASVRARERALRRAAEAGDRGAYRALMARREQSTSIDRSVAALSRVSAGITDAGRDTVPDRPHDLRRRA